MGFVAEDVPELVANNDRKSLSSMDIVAVLTQVTKEQASQLTEQKVELTDQKAKLAEKDAEVAALEDRMLQLELALTDLMHSQSPQQVSSLN